MAYNLLSIKCFGCAYAVLILSVHFSSAGLLKAIREAAVPKGGLLSIKCNILCRILAES